jgi:hypothetical protein
MGGIYQRSNWPQFTWNRAALEMLLADLHLQRGKLLGRMEQPGFTWQEKSGFENLAAEIISVCPKTL